MARASIYRCDENVSTGKYSNVYKKRKSTGNCICHSSVMRSTSITYMYSWIDGLDSKLLHISKACLKRKDDLRHIHYEKILIGKKNCLHTYMLHLTSSRGTIHKLFINNLSDTFKFFLLP